MDLKLGFISRMSVGKKLLASFSTLAGMMVFVALSISGALYGMAEAERKARTEMGAVLLQYEREIDHIVWANNLANSLLAKRSFDGQLDPKQCAFGRWFYDFKQSAYYKNASDEFRRAVDALEAPHVDLHGSAAEIVKANTHESAYSIYQSRTISHLNVVRTQLDQLRNLLRAEQDRFVAEAEQASKDAMKIVWWSTAFAIFIALFLSRTLSILIARPMAALREKATDIAKGNLLSEPMRVESSDEIGQASLAFNQMQEELRTLITNLVGISKQLADEAAHVSESTAKTNVDLQTQAMEIDQLATAMNEMSATITEVAQHAQTTSEATEESQRYSGEGQQVVQTVISSIRTLAKELDNASTVISTVEQESLNIGAILDTIQSIAEQTNLLALNAAIEAARAGEQGRGFAVVADEVRTLAARTQQSTSEIKAMIERLQSSSTSAVNSMVAGVQQANYSVQEADKAGSALQKITGSVTSITDMTHQIASATEEQSLVVKEMDRNLVQVNKLSDQTKQRSRDSDEAAEKLRSTADELLSYTKRFTL